MTRFWSPALVALLTWLLVADAAGTAPATDASAPTIQKAPGESAPARPPEPLQVSAAVAANEFAITMMVGRLPGGATPGHDQDCQGAYAWMRDRDAQLVHGLRLRVWLAASRYTQVIFQSASLRTVGTPKVLHYGTELTMYSCGDTRRLLYPGHKDAESELVGVRQETGLWFLPPLEIPTNPPDPRAPPSSWGEPYPFDLLAADTASFTIDVTVPGYAKPTDFVVDLRLRANGADRTFVLRDGDRPFTLFPDPGGAGFSPDRYHWCPGAPGRLEFLRGEEITESWRGC